MMNILFMKKSLLSRSVIEKFDLMPSARHRFEAGLIKEISEGKKVLEIGCWTGQILSLLQNKAKCTGIDIDKEAIAFAREQRKGNFVTGSALNLPFNKEIFDIAIMSHVLEHLPRSNEDKAIGEAARVLKKGGFLALSVPSTHFLSVILDPAFFILGHRHYSESQLTLLLLNHGLKIKRVIHYGNLLTLITENLHLLNKYSLNADFIRRFIDKFSENSFRRNGIAAIYILAQKI